jgi:hypothetical protein
MAKSVFLFHSIRSDHLTMNNHQETQPGVHRSPGYNHGTLVTLSQKWQVIMRGPLRCGASHDVGELDDRVSCLGSAGRFHRTFDGRLGDDLG